MNLSLSALGFEKSPYKETDPMVTERTVTKFNESNKGIWEITYRGKSGARGKTQTTRQPDDQYPYVLTHIPQGRRSTRLLKTIKDCVEVKDSVHDDLFFENAND